MESQLIVSNILPAAFLLPILAAIVVVPMTRLSEHARAIGLTVMCLGTVVVAASFIPGILDGRIYEIYLLRLTPQIWIHMRVDPMGALFGITASVLWLLALVYSFGYMADEHHKSRYYAFFMLSLAWTMGVAYSGNLLTFLVFYELFSILTYPLVTHEETPEAMAAGTKYIIYILIGSSFVLLAIVFTYFLAGDQTLATQGLLSMDMGKANLIVIFVCFLIGFGVKAAIFPLHGWVPDAHPAAPAPFSTVLSGIMVAIGTFGIMRVAFNVFGLELLGQLDVMCYVQYLAAFTIIFAAILAVNQDNLKRRLAYSTISQMGYVMLGIALLGQEAFVGALVHVTNHAFMKGTLFLCVGLLIKQAGVHNVSELRGIAKKMPITMAAFSVAALSMIGTPPLSGFVSKWYLGLGILEVEQPLYLAVLLGGALLAAIYLLPIVYAAYFQEPEPAAGDDSVSATTREAPLSMLVPVVAAAALTVILGLFASTPGLPLSLARLAAKIAFH
ncbi:MAG: proton-conducting transporter membrane subunit [Coriobacteriia bacterium]|nr:proton-conducting transporter membrane subunit [Coriobacteriia bacterium]